MIYVSRAQWGARPPKQPFTPLPSESTGIALHHEGDGLNPPTDCYAKMRSTQNYHMDAKGWNDIAYSWGVGCGLIFEGRGWGVIDGADTGPGRLMHSVVWLGDSSVAAPSDADLAAINVVLAEQARHGQPTIVGHRDINATDCPGDALYAWLQAGRPTATQPPPPPTPEDWFDMATAAELRTIIAEEVRAQCWHEAGTDRIWLAEPGGVWRRWISGPAEFDALTAYRGCRVVWNVPTDVCQALEDVGKVADGFTLTVDEVQKIPGAVAAEFALRLGA